ncbi:oligosaccharide flippase family protein [uncultured Draconibacterium sp.]|uniref:oligosaccharide flippase family protein n=1 Tax=uncultured Draconibacterium sp. TaxID=1573823 RepID=UPI002AA8790A|nr:oligosaccharide flippase family protein [uncultured Draconibacterium sp.]
MSYSNNKRIAKNTAMLYIRMILTMVVSLYTSRIILNTLGVVDFGIYNVVGGFVTMFAFFNNAMASATQRFLSFEIGKNDLKQLRNVFSMSINIHLLIALLILLFAETLGLWFFKTQLTIPQDRLIAAKWVFHFSILALIVNMLSVPYNAAIIAHERMKVFAWVSIIEVSLKLLIVFMLQWFGLDKLKFYAVLVFSVSLIIRIIYGIYCSRNFKESKFRFYWNQQLFKTLANYAGWNLWGNVASVIMGQGINVLLNIFFGPVVNAARGIAFQVRAAMNSFVQNFQMAMNPQIIKSYASGDIKYMHQLIFQGAKYSFFLLFMISLPVILETEYILKLWLKTVPEHTLVFTRLVLINILIDSISGPLMTAAQATGKIKLYQSIVGGLLILNLPVSYFFLQWGYPPEITLWISIGISINALIARLIIVRILIQIEIACFLSDVILRIASICIITPIFPIIINMKLSESFFRLILLCIISLLSSAVIIYFVGLANNERAFIMRKLIKRNNFGTP